MYRTILVGVDGSEPSDRAVEHALEQAGHSGATLHAVFVVDTRHYPEPALSSAELTTDALEDWGQEQLDEVVARGDAAGVDVVTLCCHGDPAREILDYADSIGADVVVLGYRGQTHAGEAHVGSVTHRVVRNADRPVLVV